ncbi:hypothetical protein Hypma_010116 [Hypsizygus marmoreus]|uniref:Uncharacterized protein n=1 Tax=Hypsizygus marmoreus TaxID=39966 RepID=A0A369JKU3_HYPMA|nr:hypothetical protein Hypma_010116 [Hypsizygus marmoreus]
MPDIPAFVPFILVEEFWILARVNLFSTFCAFDFFLYDHALIVHLTACWRDHHWLVVVHHKGPALESFRISFQFLSERSTTYAVEVALCTSRTGGTPHEASNKADPCVFCLPDERSLRTPSKRRNEIDHRPTNTGEEHCILAVIG